MSSTEQNKSGGKSGRRSRKSERAKKAEVASPADMQAIEQALSVELNSTEPESLSHAEADHLPAAEPRPVLAEQLEPVAAAPAPADTVPISLQTIANAYRDYTRKSFAEFGSYVEQISGVRSLDKAMIVQSEFMKRVYETSVAESQKICELHGKLARQSLQPFQGRINKGSETSGKP